MRLPEGLAAAPQAEAAWEAARVLEEGGNAADALVTGALVQGVVDPHRCGIGGFGCATVSFPSRGDPVAIDFHGHAGERCHENMWVGAFESVAEDGFGYVLRHRANDLGYGSITVPGMLAGLHEIHSRFGSMPWRELALRAVPYAEHGFVVGPHLADYWARPGAYGRASTQERLAFGSEGRRLFLDVAGRTLRAGDVLRQPDLARTYRSIADDPACLYVGALADRIVRDWEEHGANVTRADLARYRPTVQAPLTGTFRGARIVTTPPPGGGAALLQALSLLEGDDVPALGQHSAACIDRVAHVLHAVGRERLGADSPCTTQLTIVDRDENAISFSHSLGFGSGVVTPSLGFVHNNCMSGFDPRPGRPGSIAPGRARTTAIAETLVWDDDGLRLVMGSPGAARITAALAQVLLAVLEFDVGIAEAVVQPRFFPFGERRLELESRFPSQTILELASRGWRAQRSIKPFGQVGRVYAIEIDRRGPTPKLRAGIDPGEPGAGYRAI
ncbi:gamma-glutamyltransferase [Pendulispora rubella]|uniref:Gamma-glutamyltransferase n=1 Tax=Pendulispora rubella TaxID=2741070 RepID=A0ABZ2L262_9BACT